MKKAETILVIEEDDNLRGLLEQMLGNHFAVESFSNGVEGLAWLTEGNEADLILTDLVMTEISGFQLLRNIKTSGIFGHIPLIVLSDGDPANENKCEELGIQWCLSKPFRPETLIEIILLSVGGNQKTKTHSETQKLNTYAQHSIES